MLDFPFSTWAIQPSWLLERCGVLAMQIRDDVRQTVVFIGTRDNEGHFIPRATGFIIAEEIEQWVIPYVVTAEHVISGLNLKGHKTIYVRVNKKDGGVIEAASNADHWFFHPDEHERTDIAMIPFPGDHEKLEILYIHKALILSREKIKEINLGIGDEVFIPGLFRSHYGQQKNVPIIRVGNLAMMNEEPVYTRYAGYLDAFLIEARSISGLSGSPVWVHLPLVMIVDKQLKFQTGQTTFLLGLIHGHFDVKNLNEDIVTEDQDGTGGINTGIGIVIPAYKILETMERHPDLIEWKKNMIKLVKLKAASRGATPDLDADEAREPPTTDENPRHREDFSRLLDAAVKGPRPSGKT